MRAAESNGLLELAVLLSAALEARKHYAADSSTASSSSPLGLSGAHFA